jgi:general secretion pathway protein A
MYKSFFGLRENPFNINPDPRFLHRTPRIQEALDQLTFGVQNRKGLLLLTGEVGTGKTTLINHLLDWLRQQKTPTAFIFNSHLKVNHLFDFILNDFGISTDLRVVSNMLLELNQWLIHRFRAGFTPVLIVDEAQGLSLELLEEIRLLLNLETASEKLLQIVLVGQPELEEKLRRPELRQLRQRIALRCNTSPLSLAESRGYIVERLRIAGATAEPIFEPDAVEALHYYSRGIPRVMNLLCEHALINAYVEGLNPVPPPMVEEAARDFLMEEFRPLPAYSGMTMRSDSNPSLMNLESAGEPGRPSWEDANGSWLPAGSEMSSRAIAFTEEERMPSTENSMIATAPQEEEDSASEKHSDTALSVLDLVPASTEFVPQQRESKLSSKPSAAQSDCAAQLAATMARLLAAASSAPGSRRAFSKAVGESSLGLPSIHPGAPIRSATSTALWSGVFTRALLTAQETFAAVGCVLRQWTLGFSRDWKLTVDSLNIPQIKKSLAHWIRQPISSKSLASRKNQTV